MEKREDRRDRTYRKALRQWKIHMRDSHGHGGWLFRKPCGRDSVLYWKKWRARSCRCTRAKKGNPKVPAGMCVRGGAEKYQGCVEDRIDGNRRVRDLKRFLFDQDYDDYED
jgi:hypothetical protein